MLKATQDEVIINWQQPTPMVDRKSDSGNGTSWCLFNRRIDIKLLYGLHHKT